jgi:signal transduction histidine kinase
MESTNPNAGPSSPVPDGGGGSRIFAEGEMADLTRAFDWGRTVVGPIEQWPEALLVTVNTILNSRQPMFLWWGEELVQFYNDAYRPSIASDKHPKALGWTGRDCWPEIWPIIGPEVDAVMTCGEASWHEDQLVPIYRDGVLEDVYWTYGYSPVRDAAGNIRGTLVTCIETTGRVHAQRAALEERARLADLFQQAPAFFAVMRGPEHVFELTNPLYQELIGGRSVIGKPVREAVPEAGEQGFFSLLDGVYRSGEPFVGRGTRISLARSVGQPLEERYLDFVYQPMREADGSISGIIVLGIDVTDAKRAELALIQAEKLSAVGRLASSIAHEINNPLEAVTNLLYLLETRDDPEEWKGYLAQAQAELARVAKITMQTLRFHRQSTKASDTSLSDVLEGVLTLMHGRVMNAQVTVERRYRGDTTIKAYAGDLRQVFANLVVNALDASAHGCQIILAVRDAVDWSSGERGVRVTVADTGCGMSEETRLRIFDPFFTTKGNTGTGLGLWVSATILEAHQAKVRVRSSEHKERHGTVFSIFFPLQAVADR